MIRDNHVVEINYTLFDESGEIIDSSDGKAPLAYIQGKKNIIPGLEKKLNGKNVGDSFKAIILPEDAYGNHHEMMVHTVPLNDFGPNPEEMKVGDVFQVQNNNGQVMAVKVIEVNPDKNEITLDGNHPLAGKTLTFDVEVVSFREATEEELAQGHVHQETSCQDPSCC